MLLDFLLNQQIYMEMSQKQSKLSSNFFFSCTDNEQTFQNKFRIVVRSNSTIGRYGNKMYITVALRNQNLRKQQKKHDQSIFKEISFQQSVKQRSQKQKQRFQQNLWKSYHLNATATDLQTIRCSKSQKGSKDKEYIQIERKTVGWNSKNISQKEEKYKSKSLIKTLHESTKFSQNQVPSKYQQQNRSNSIEQDQNSSSNQGPRKTCFSKKTKFDNIQEGRKLKRKKLNHKKSRTTIFDERISDLQKITQLSKNSNPFLRFQAKEQENQIIKQGWGRIFKESKDKYSIEDSRVSFATRLKKARHTVTSHLSRKNNSKEMFRQYDSRLQNIQNRQQIQKSDTFDINLETEKMSSVYHVLKGGENFDEFSDKVSLLKYSKDRQRFYTLKNLEQSIKKSDSFKKLTVDNFKKHEPKNNVKSFMYIHQNQQRLLCRKDSRNLFGSQGPVVV